MSRGSPRGWMGSGRERALVLRLCGLVALLLASLGLLAAETTLYVNEYFEVRGRDEPVKYIFDGDTRVARVTGSLTNTTRVQRLRLEPGWNLRALALTVTNALAQLTNAQPAGSVAGSVFRWDQGASAWHPVAASDPLPAGTVLWLHAGAPATVALAGAYPEPIDRVLPAGGTFSAGSGLQAMPVPPTSQGLALWRHDASDQVWRLEGAALPSGVSGIGGDVAPGEALFVDAAIPVAWEVADPALQVRYYHPDHLGSSTVVTDAQGVLVEETAHFPFGAERHVHQPRQIEEAYGFTGKERDSESGLHYFEARYLTGPVARFVSADPKYARLEGLSPGDFAGLIASPRDLNPYQYGANNPLRFSDPSGLDKVDTVSQGNDLLGAAAGGAEEYSFWARKTIEKGALEKGAGVVSKGTAVVSVGIKAAQFFDDPNSATGGQLLNESAKSLVGVVAPPVGLLWSVLDLTPVGPGKTLEYIERSIQANRAATKSYNQATAAWRQAAATYNEGAARVGPRLREVDAKLQHLVRETNKLNEKTRESLKGETRSLKELNDAIARQERINRVTRAELRRAEARLKRAQE